MDSQSPSDATGHKGNLRQRPWWAQLHEQQRPTEGERRKPRGFFLLINPLDALGALRIPSHLEKIHQNGKNLQARFAEVATGLPDVVGQAWQNVHNTWQSHAEVHSTRHVLRRFLHRRGEDVPSKQTHMFASLSVGNMVQRAGSAIRTRNNSGPMLASLPDPDSKSESKGNESDDMLTRRREDEDKQYETMIEFENSPDSTYTRLTVKTEFKDGLLLELCSGISSLGLSIVGATIETESGRAKDTFLIKDEKGGKVKEQQWHLVRTRLLASCRRRGGKGWREKDRRLREIFNMIDSKKKGHIKQEDVNRYARKLRLPTPFVADFVQEHDTMDDDRLTFEEFAASVRAKEAILYTVFDEIDTGNRGYVGRRHLEAGLRNVEVRSGRYGKRKKISKAGVVKMMSLLDHRKHIVREEFRDLFIMLPSKELVTVTPYFMKVGLDIGRIMPPDRRKDGPPWGHFVAGGLAGVVSKTLSSPLHVISIRMATNSIVSKAVTPGGVWGVIGRSILGIYKKDGMGGFFCGNFTNAMSSAPGKAIDFFSYAALKNHFTKGECEPNDAQRFVAGAIAGMCSDAILYPLELVSTRIAAGDKYKAVIPTIRTIMAEEGIKGFYSGLGSALIGVVPYAGVSFAAYDMFSTNYRKWAGVETAGILPTFCCGLASGWLASTLSFPLYNVTIRLQAQGASTVAGQVMYTGMMDAFRKILAQQGIKGLYLGYVPASLKMIPMSGASFTTYELVKQYLRNADNQQFKQEDEDNDDQDDHYVQHPPLMIEALKEAEDAEALNSSSGDKLR